MATSESRSALVLHLAEEFLERYRQGQRPSLKEYIDSHPQLAAEIKEVFPAMALMENVALADESLAGEATGPAAASTTGGQPPQQLGDYRILREVGRGGMGIVYEAEQVSLGRHVALKVLPRKVLLDQAHKRRFEREARSAAKLHHTNIVPVFGVGEHEGLPYYVMQFIQGLGLDDVLDELKRMQSSGTATATDGQFRAARKDVSAVEVARSLLTGAFEPGARSVSTSGKLSDSFTLSSSLHLTSAGVKGKKLTYWQSVARLGVQVADALEYAHKQGIQHRDIKPSNLLLDTCGSVWVTDFGLARADNEDHLTQTGDIVGTLRYMPPEAFEGRADKRGDIYSLGLTLYELLALQPAFAEKDRHKLIKRVTTEEPARLDKLNRVIPRDLVTIVQKAIDREPGRRYQTAGELSADLQRFLDDEPIRARRISNRERLLRWCRHHPGVASLTAILVLVLVGTTAVSLLAAAYFDQLAHQERQAKDHEAALREQAEEAKQQAEQQKQQAESNFAKARKAVDDYFITVSESKLLQVPGLQTLRRDLLRSALTFYQDFLKERGDDPALRGELAAAYLRLGKIRSELDENAEARQAFEQARELYEQLTERAPESVEWRHGQAQCYLWLGRCYEAIALWQKLVRPGQPRFQKELADAYNKRGTAQVQNSFFEEALQDHHQALTIWEMLVHLTPEDPDVQRELGATLKNIGDILTRKGRTPEALATYRRCAQHQEAAFARAPQVINNGRFLANTHLNIALIERRTGKLDEALAAFQRCVEIWQKLVRNNPAVPSLHRELVSAYMYLGGCQSLLKQNQAFERTIRLTRELIESMPTEGSAGELFEQATLIASFANYLGRRKAKPTGEEQAEQKRVADVALEALRKAVAAGFEDAEILRRATVFNSLRDREDFKAVEADLAARRAATPQDKLRESQQALALRQKLAQADPKNKDLQAVRAASHHAVALLQLDFGKWEEARKNFEQAAALREALVKDEPTNEQYQADLAASRLALESVLLFAPARRLVEQKRNEEAEAALAKIEERKSNKMEVWKECGRLRFALGQTDKAEADFRKAVELLNDLALEALPSVSAASEADELFARQADDALLQRLTAAVERNPEDMDRRWKRGHWHAQHARWKEAAADWGTMLERKPPDDALRWLQVAPVLAVSDREGYRRQCHQMLKRFGETQDLATAERIAKACLLLPEFAKEMEPACELADRAVSREKNHPYRRFFALAKGLADYRRGNFRAAIEGLDPLVPQTGQPELATHYHLVLALALHQQGDEKAAREHLAQGAKLLDQNVLDPVRAPILKMPNYYGMTSRYYHDWLIAWLLQREAQTLIEGEKGKSKK